MRDWGVRHGKAFWPFYAAMGLINDDINKEEGVAFANIAWCATKGDKYPNKMLSHCYAKHTEELVRILEPDMIILSGSKTHRFESNIKKVLPNSKIVTTFHYACYKSKDQKKEEQKRVKKLVFSMRTKK
jgi:hypothetical protein